MNIAAAAAGISRNTVFFFFLVFSFYWHASEAEWPSLGHTLQKLAGYNLGVGHPRRTRNPLPTRLR
jgi:hypothetical protein